MIHLKVVSINVTPVFEMAFKEDGSVYGIGGADFNFLQIISEKLPFKYDLSKMYPLDYGTPNEKGEWTGMMKQLVSKEVDMALGWMGNNDKRQEVIEFSFPYMMDTDIFITSAPKILEREYAFLDPFQLLVWILLVLSLPISAAVLVRMSPKYRKTQNQCGSLKIWFAEIYSLLALLLNQGNYKYYTQIKAQFFMYIWSLSKLVLVLSYLCNLLSFLMIPLMEKPLNDIHELRDAVLKGKYQVATLYGTTQLGNLMAAESGAFRDLADNIRQHDENIVPSYTELIPRVETERLAAVVLRLYFVFVGSQRGLHRYHMSKESLGFNPISVALARGFPQPHIERLNYLIHRITESGLYMKKVNDLVYQSTIKARISPSSSRLRPLSFTDIKTPLELLLCGYLLAALCLIAEFSYRNFKLKSKKIVV